MCRLAYVLAIASVLAFAPRPAAANGRFPQTMSCDTRPGDDQFILVGATFGLLLSRDDGQTWDWVCENAVGYGGTFDPDYDVAADGTMYATTFEGLRTSTTDGCTWDLIGGPLEGHWVGDIEIGPDGTLWATTSSGEMANLVATSSDGANFTTTALTHDEAWFKTVRVAPADGQRAYVSAYLPSEQLGDAGMTDPEALAYRTEDGGDTWTPLDLSDIQFGSQPQLEIVAVDPSDPDTVYANAISANPPLGDAIYRSTDKGVSWTKLIDTEAPVQVVQFTSDRRLWVSWVGTSSINVVVFEDGAGEPMSPGYQPSMMCLCEREADGDLFACGANWEPDFFGIGRSTDGGDSYDSILRFAEIDGPLECEPGTIQYDTCETKFWPPLCQQFGCNKPDAGPGGDVDAGVGPDGGDGNGGNDDCGGCSSGESLGGLLLVLFALPLALRRRRAIS